ncbi:glycerophosphodiester phosphodiesterase family protein [Macrococcus capreoli]|uniref:glycerophosphodiester phosphodiesterase n=1 Tax=Macrococcus capreoli TaxID=2982690 RepID=UPI0021D5A5DB|nr:glycerophosphodiester phosphodiesterase family protein [Macrococcus sp. TMW 2.2395]MCU7558281.1 glycerophosphodiester phosphodiesterase family protein [Macrococcus sp. TMW 2.2395]
MKKTLSFVLTVLLFMLLVPHEVHSVTQINRDVLTVAHRGASGYAPENTMAAFELALAMHADCIELDLQLTRDGQLVVIHDNTLERTTTGTGNIWDRTLSEIKQYDAGIKFDQKYQGERVPTFDEVLKRFKNESIGILIEIKTPEYYPGIEEKIKQSLKHYGLDQATDRIAIQSFNHHAVKVSKSLLPKLKHGVLISPNNPRVQDRDLQWFKSFADFYNPSVKIVSHDLVERAHRYGFQVKPYTVRDQALVAPLIHQGVDAIITDYPDFMNPYDHNKQQPVRNMKEIERNNNVGIY